MPSLGQKLSQETDIWEYLSPKDKMKVKFYSFSIPSTLHRGSNEDAYFVDKKSFLAGVFDGVGGLPFGERTSLLAKNLVLEKLKKISSVSMEDVLIDVSKRLSSSIPGGGSTATIVKFLPKGRKLKAVLAHVGDSRAYLFRMGKVSQITDDDSMVPSREIQEKLDDVQTRQDFEKLTLEEKWYFQNRNVISQMLGGESAPIPHIYQLTLKKKDIIILTTDGIHDNLTVLEIEKVLKSSKGDLAKALIKQSYQRSQDAHHIRAKPDDMTVLIIWLA